MALLCHTQFALSLTLSPRGGTAYAVIFYILVGSGAEEMAKEE